MQLGKFFTGRGTPGTVRAGKALIADANKDVTGIRNLEVSGTVTVAGTALAATPAEINRVADVSARIVAAIADLPIVEATHEGKIITLAKVDGLTVTLPAASGGGARYEFLIAATVTSNQYRWSVTGNDTFFGVAFGVDGDGEPGNGWAPVAGNNQINLGGASNATGGVKGDRVLLVDFAADCWYVQITSQQGGTEATPFATAA